MNRPYKLWLDDERKAPSADWITARSRTDFEHIINTFGMPYLMDLDHDLGDPDPSTTGMACLHWLYSQGYDIADTEIKVHSSNFDGRNNMISYIESWKKSI